jgi:hypothetical protein
MSAQDTIPDILGAAGGYDIDDLLGQSVGDMTKSEPVPEGVYHCRVNKSEVKAPKQPTKVNQKTKEVETSFPYVNWDYVITGGSPEEYHGRHFFEVGTLKPGATFVNRNVLEALGFEEDVTLRDALPECPDRELLIAVIVEPEGLGADGKWYPARNKIVKRLPLAA